MESELLPRMILLTVYPIPTVHPEIIYKKPYYMDSAVCFYIFMHIYGSNNQSKDNFYSRKTEVRISEEVGKGIVDREKEREGKTGITIF